MKGYQFVKILIVFLSITSIHKLEAQIKCKIENYSTEDGLSHDAIRDILKDKEGFMWFATWDGLNRFDGKNFITYKASAGDKSSLGNNRIDLMKEDTFGNIWFKAYDSQIYRFEKSTEKFLSIANIVGTNKINFNEIIAASNGNVWLTTHNKGLFLAQKQINNKIKTIHFAHGLKNNFSITSNDINFAFEDKDSSLWIGSENGLDIITNNKNENYKSQNLLKNNSLKIYLDTGEIIWFGTGNGYLIRYNKIKKNYTKTAINNSAINSIVESKEDNLLYISSSNGKLITFNTQTLKIQATQQISNAPIYKVYQDKQNLLWIEPSKHGVFMVNPKNRSVQFFSQQTDATFLQLEHSFGVFEDNFNRVWVKLKGGGLGYYNKKTKSLDYFHNKPGEENQKFSNIIACLFFDPSGILWMSTNDRGINKIIFQKNNFEQKQLVERSKDKSENEIRAVFNDKNNRLWIASKAGKIKIYKNGEEIKNLFSNYPNGEIGLVYSITGDAKGNIWLGTKGNGLFKAIPTNIQNSQYFLKQFKTNKNNPKSINSNLIYSVLEDKKGRIWVGTYESGINLIEEKEDEIIFIHHFKNYPLLESSRVRYLTLGYQNEIWVATTNGLVTFKPDDYNPNTIQFSRYIKNSNNKLSLNSNDILFMIKDSDKKMWIATAGGGLNLATKTKNNKLQFKNLTKENGLPSDFILSMVEDENKNLWLATENGISKFNLQNHSFRNYDSTDGLSKIGFSESTSLKLPNGNLIFGARNGYLNFNPNKIENQKNSTKMVFTDFEINNKTSNIKSTEFPLERDINYNNNIELLYNENTISIYYTVLDYRYNNKQKYVYRLKGLDNTWHEVKNQKKATFTNLPPGDYQFQVKCINTELYNNSPQKNLNFTITPPFWKTNFAYFIYLLLILGILEIIRKTAYSMISLSNKVIVEEKMTELKLSFFTNISHELRTPLTLIVNPINEIAKNENLSPLGTDYIETVQKNTNRLVRFVNQLLDFRKVQTGNEELHIEPIELVNFTNQLSALFAHAAHEKNIIIKTQSSFETLTVNLDREKMDIVLYNLLSNAIKFSPNDSTIIIAVKLENTILKIDVIDEGTGVEKNKLDAIFKLYYETDNGKSKEVGTGIGLALCKEYIQLHQGLIFAKNNDTRGLTISIEIDLSNKIFENNNFIENRIKKKAVIQNPIFKPAFEEEKIADNLKLPLVLLVEDNQELRKFLKIQLQKYYRIAEAENGKEGLEMAKQKLPDLIVSDIMMPEMDGIELLESLKNTTETSHIPVILLTAKSAIESQIKGLNYGADYYITKPFNTDFLLASVQNLIKHRKSFFKNLQTKTVTLEPSKIVITTKDEQFLKDIINVVEEGLTNPDFNIEVIAKSQNMARVTFNRKFKSLTNLTPVEFVKDMRVKRAKQFLDAGEHDIADIAYRVGFNSAGYFSTCFKEIYKITPSDYLKQKSE